LVKKKNDNILRPFFGFLLGHMRRPRPTANFPDKWKELAMLHLTFTVSAHFPFPIFILLNNFCFGEKRNILLFFGLLNAQVYELHEIFLLLKKRKKKETYCSHRFLT
jgi:hypothetical protein